MAYQIRAYSKEDKTVHDIKEFKFDDGLNMISTYKDTLLNLDNTDYIIIQSQILKDLLGCAVEPNVTKRLSKKKNINDNETES